MEALSDTELLSQEDLNRELSGRLPVEKTDRMPTLSSLTTTLLDLHLKVPHAVVQQVMIILVEWVEWVEDQEETAGELQGNKNPPAVITTTTWV